MEPTTAPSESETQTTYRIPWRSVEVLDSDGATPLDEVEAISALREYRQHGSIAGRFLGRVGLPTEDPDDASTWGPTVEQIDWTGFPADGQTTYRIRIDLENAAEAWWAAARAAADVPPLLAPLLAVGGVDEVVTASGVTAEQAIAWAASLPGWDGPEYAPHPLILECRRL